MSEIVERLRVEADALDNSFRRNLAVTSTEAVTMREAAAHIERIEALNAELVAAARRALNFIENTEGEIGDTLESGDLLRAALASTTPTDASLGEVE